MKSLSIVSFLLLSIIVIHHHVEAQEEHKDGGKVMKDSGKKKYCVPKKTTDVTQMADCMKESCETPNIDCSMLQTGHPCVDKCARTRSGYGATLYYRKFNKCDCSGTFELVEKHPSIGECKFP